MGVTYKLTDDVVAFILDQKKQSANLSCRELVELVDKQFGRVVSKSSVHEVLKEANIVSPRGRKFKNKFQIPDDKKAQLIASLPPAIIANIPTVPQLSVETPLMASEDLPIMSSQDDIKEDAQQDEPLTLRVEPMIPLFQDPPREADLPTINTLPPLEDGADVATAKDFFIQAAFNDLFPSPWGSVKSVDDLENVDAATLAKEAAYRQIGVACLKVELGDDSHFFIDARHHDIARNFCEPLRLTPIETATLRMADTLLNNIRPLIIKNIKSDFLDAAVYDFLRAMSNDPSKQISRIALVDSNQDVLIDFAPIAHVKRQFIIGIDVANKDMASLMAGDLSPIQMVNTYVLHQPVKFVSRDIILADESYRGFVILSSEGKPERVLITNIANATSDQDIVLSYVHTFTLDSAPEDKKADNATLNNLKTDYAAHLFGVFDDSANALRTRRQFNARLNVVTIDRTEGYKDFDSIEHSCRLLNNLDIIDQHGRKIWARLG